MPKGYFPGKEKIGSRYHIYFYIYVKYLIRSN